MIPPTRAPSAWRSANAEPTCPPAVLRRLDAPYTAVRPNTTSTAASSASRRVSQRRSVIGSHLLHELSEQRAPLLVILEHVVARARGREQHHVPDCAARRARATTSVNVVPRSSGTLPSRSCATIAPASPNAITSRHFLATSSGASRVYGSPLCRPPSSSTNGRSIASTATTVEAMLVALEALIHSTPPTSRTGSSRCGSARNDRSPRAIDPGATPASRTASAAASALATL